MRRRQILSLFPLVVTGHWFSNALGAQMATDNESEGVAEGVPEGGQTSITLDAFQPPLDVTLMGVVVGAARFYETRMRDQDQPPASLSDAMLFGGTGQAFLINLNETVEQASPYVWNRTPFYQLARNTGLRFRDLGFFSGSEPVEERQRAQELLREALMAGTVCSLINMEHQLVTGFDETGLITSPPWPWNKAFPPRRLSFDNWAELGEAYHCNLFVIEHVEPASTEQIINDGFEYALSVLQTPQEHQLDGFDVGLAAYDRWIDAISEHGGTHGHWWNAAVWGQCRDYAQKFCVEVAEHLPVVAEEAYALAEQYGELAAGFRFVGDTVQPLSVRRTRLNAMRDIEAGTEQLLSALLAKLPPQDTASDV